MQQSELGRKRDYCTGQIQARGNWSQKRRIAWQIARCNTVVTEGQGRNNADNFCITGKLVPKKTGRQFCDLVSSRFLKVHRHEIILNFF